MNVSLRNRINTSTITKLVLIAEILAISILHSVKISHEKRPQAVKQEISLYTVDKEVEKPVITLANK